MPPLDNLAWYGWDTFKHSVAQHRADNTKPVEMKYIGWGCTGSATRRSRCTSPGLLRGDIGPTKMPSPSWSPATRRFPGGSAAGGRRGGSRCRPRWLIASRSWPGELLIRIMRVTFGARSRHRPRAEDPCGGGRASGCHDDDLSTAWNIPGPARGAAITLYKSEAPFMRVSGCRRRSRQRSHS